MFKNGDVVIHQTSRNEYEVSESFYNRIKLKNYEIYDYFDSGVFKLQENKMTNKEQLLNKLAELQKNITDAQKQAEELQKQINEPEKPKALLERVEEGSVDAYYYFTSMNDIALATANNTSPNTYKGTVFTTQEQAENYRKAFEVFLELRRCEGSEVVSTDTQFVIRPFDSTVDCIEVAESTHCAAKASDISPCFDSRESANRAINKLGAENILHMFRTFHGLT